MFEQAQTLAYHKTMTRTSTGRIMLRRFISFFNLIEQPKSVAPKPGESVAFAWAATGRYLRNAMNSYDPAPSKPTRLRH